MLYFLRKLEDLSLLLPIKIIEELERNLDPLPIVVILVNDALELRSIPIISLQVDIHRFNLQSDLRYLLALAGRLLRNFYDLIIKIFCLLL